MTEEIRLMESASFLIPLRYHLVEPLKTDVDVKRVVKVQCVQQKCYGSM
jgi:hypothetical protein